MEREGERCWRGGWIPTALCRCACIQPHFQLVPAAPWALGLAAATQDQGSGSTVQSCQASRLAGQVTGFCTRLHIFLPKGP